MPVVEATAEGFARREANYTALTSDADPRVGERTVQTTLDLDVRLIAEFWCWVLDMPDDDYPTFLETVLFEARPSNRRLSSSGHFSGNEPR
ncbi:MAG: hypothetical protein ACT4QA_20895 [Panacagrimonas sp.]